MKLSISTKIENLERYTNSTAIIPNPHAQTSLHSSLHPNN